ncbi:MAG TPA: hypothetical protein VGA33_10525, partial [Thermoanaerobaculia bacterium]
MRKLLAAALLIAACKSAPAVKEVPASALVDRSGDSMEAAVAVPADAPNGGIDFRTAGSSIDSAAFAAPSAARAQ